jgi:hypothetical protein
MACNHVRWAAVTVRSVGALAVLAATAAPAVPPTYSVGPITNISSTCSGQNAEVEQAVDPTNPEYVYEEWMGCKGIAFSVSTDGGLRFSVPIAVPGSVGSNVNSWDPAVAVGPDGTVYAAFMLAKGGQWYPVVAASFDHGFTFPQVTSLIPPDAKNWGDREFIAVGPDGTVYVTWDYGPERTSVTFICAASGSCAFLTGDLNVVIQKSTDGGKTFGPMVHVSPGFPASGGDSAPLVVEPNGQIDLLYQGYQITNTTTFTMNPAFSYFTSSTDGGQTWSAPIKVGPQAGTMSLSEWWIDGDISMDSAGNLYATWDTQGTNSDGTPNDVGWLSFSTDHGQKWSDPVQVTPDNLNVPHIVQVAGGGSGIAYVAWLSNSNPQGYALYLRTFSVTRGWLSDPIQVSTAFGNSLVWPGDTIGISAAAANNVVLSWGSAISAADGGKQSEIFAAPVSVAFH